MLKEVHKIVRQSGERRIIIANSAASIDESNKNDVVIDGSHFGLIVGEMALKAKKAGADLVLERGEVEALANNKKKQKKIAETYNFFIAEAPLMPIVGRVLGSTLGPRGRMPTPLHPTSNVGDYIERHRKMVLARLRGQPVIQCAVGNEISPDEQIAENVKTTLRSIERKLKRGDKNIRSVYLKTTMGSPAKVKM